MGSSGPQSAWSAAVLRWDRASVARHAAQGDPASVWLSSSGTVETPRRHHLLASELGKLLAG